MPDRRAVREFAEIRVFAIAIAIEVEQLVEEMFASKRALIATNMEAIELGYAYALEHFDCPLPTRKGGAAA